MAEERAILGYLQNNEQIPDSGQFSAEHKLDHDQVKNVIRSLQGFRYIDAQGITRKTWVLSEEGKKYAAQGSPEVQLFLAVPEEGSISVLELKKKLGESIDSFAWKYAKENKWVEMEKKQVSRKVQHVDDVVQALLLQIQEGKEIDEDGILFLKGRKNLIEQVFWNFDALFQPQQHPARDSHDTFFLKSPSTTRKLPEDYVERVKQVHESGGYGSRGYNYDWKREEANKNLLRTHTTAVSSKMLYELAKQQPFVPKKYFSIDRVFRNEAVDRTHLAEFHQIEGLICDRGLTLGHLKGVLEDFFSRLGMTDLKFKPAYNPYTEPSMEIFSYHKGLGKLVEIGNSGMFRPEMLLPMGLPEDVRVIAWGLSLERPTMILYGIDNIRDLFGHKWSRV